MKSFFFCFLSVGVCLSSCIKRGFNPESEVKGGGAGDGAVPIPDGIAVTDPSHYAVDDSGRMITQNKDGSYNVRCNRGPDERRLTAALLDSGDYCIQEKNAAVPGQTQSSFVNEWDPIRFPASPGFFKKYLGRVVGTNFNGTACSIDVTSDSTGFVLSIRYKYKDADYEETIHTSKFALPPRYSSLIAYRNGPLSVSRTYNIGLERSNGNWQYFSSKAFSGGRLECSNLKHVAQ
jgi:hypothetical protein